MVVWCVSVDTTILHIYLSEPACTACTNMVYSKELERDVTTAGKALSTAPKNFGIIPYRT